MSTSVVISNIRIAMESGEGEADLFALFYVMLKMDVARKEGDLSSNFCKIGE